MTNQTTQPASSKTVNWGQIGLNIALVVTILAGATLRLAGVNWDENQHMHPDERFLSLVQAAIAPVENLSDYFNTDSSSLNPANRGYGFFVYGTVPLFLVRYIGETLGQTDYHAITVIGRIISAVFDVMTITLVFYIGKRLYNKWTGLLGALFYAFSVLPIQLSHYATVDAITNTFAYLAVYAAVWALMRQPKVEHDENEPPGLAEEVVTEGDSIEQTKPLLDFLDIKRILGEVAPYILFGVALGLATASKINAVVLAVILPLVEGIRFLRMGLEARRQGVLKIVRNLAIAAVLSFIVFRIGQPYAFNGPGFLNMGINEGWWSSLQSLRAQSSGDVDFPPALQWARRPITFSWENLATWGLGLPLGLFATLSFLTMGYFIIRKRDWQQHLPLWAFTGFYFIWQSLSWVRSMRYQMLIYPALALFAGWRLVKLWSARESINLWKLQIKPKVIKITGMVLTAVLILTTAAWGFMFSGIYTRPHTRVAASRWIYQNISGALTLQIETAGGDYQQPLPYRAGDTFTAENPYRYPFYGIANGVVQTVTFPYMLDQAQTEGLKQVTLSVFSFDAPEQTLAAAVVESAFLPSESDWRGSGYEFIFPESFSIDEGALYYLQLDIQQEAVSILLNGSPSLHVLTNRGMELDESLPRILQSATSSTPYTMNIQVVESGSIAKVDVPFLVDLSGQAGLKEATLTIFNPNLENGTASAQLQAAFNPGDDIRGDAYSFVLEKPIAVEKGQVLTIDLTTQTEGARLVPHGYDPVHESSWDDAVPYPVDGFSPYSESGGIYREDLNFEMYWADNELKLEMFENNLDRADYIFITSSRQWGTTTRVPERYLLTTFYYRNLIGCPADADIEWCYSVAEPGMFEGSLGFELVETFDSNPSLDGIEINTQFAEEAFTVYDHPKVLIFKKTDAYDPIKMRELLRSVDLSQVVYFTPGDAATFRLEDLDQLTEPKYNLMLPEERLEGQQEGGTWSELFDRDSLVNSSQVLSAAALYLLVMLLGILCYPFVMMAMPGLSDRGYPLSKLIGMLFLAFLTWVLGSFGVSITRGTILYVLIGMGLISGAFIFLQRKSLWDEIKSCWRYYLAVEMIALVAFIGFLLIRMGNPDLWHPYKGGEKPMDFSYLNAVLKSTSFPPYDPWYAGGFINYYYYGFVIVGMPIKLLGIIPSVAYNIILPIWYSILILGAFSVGWNLYQSIPRPRALSVGKDIDKRVLNTAFWVGLATAVGLAVLGNLGTVKLIMTTMQKIAAGGAVVDDAGFFRKLTWTIQGLVQYLQGTPLPLYPGDWYWYPSRVIPGEPITEFPYFSFIYGDLHAHLLAFPITILAISWSLSVVLQKTRWGEEYGRFKIFPTIVSAVIGALAIGALRATNTWDFYTYIVFASIALLYSFLRHYRPRLSLKIKRGVWVEKLGAAVIAILVFALLSILLYQPFSSWFRQGYTSVKVWEGDRTPLSSYFTHWGLFLFVIISWMGWDTYHWLKNTPQSALERLKQYKAWINAALIFFPILLLALLLLGVSIALVAVPLGLWVVILMLRSDCSDGRRFLLFMIGTALTLTLVVELIYMPGDIGRMNTVFKFYLEAWILFALSAGVCLGWVVKSLRDWNKRLGIIWQVAFVILVTSAALFTVLGTADKIRDRMVADAPHTLDGMAYMAYATYYDMGVDMVLEEDYQVILWMQENIEGSPVILEGQAYEYRWGNRYTINTGLPGVVGWNWHQRQRRAVLANNAVQERVDAVGTFYLTEDPVYVVDFIETYDVSYIILGQLERAFFPGVGLDKFTSYEGELWQEVYRYGSTIVYEVLD